MIHVKNGMILFDEGSPTLVPFSPDYRSQNACPYPYDPGATCPRFLNDLLGSALDEQDILLVQKWAGSVILGQNLPQRFLILLGTAGGGKSTLMSIIEQVVGLQNVAQLKTNRLADRFELFSFCGKSLLVGKDVPSDFLRTKGAQTIKGLIGGDIHEAEKKGANERY